MLEEDFKKINELLAGSTNNQDGGKPDSTNIENNTPVTQYMNLNEQYQSRRNIAPSRVEGQEEFKNVTHQTQYLNIPQNVSNQPDENIAIKQNMEKEESYTDKSHENTASMKKATGTTGIRKSKRGRKRKHREPKDNSTESDSDVFDYDKFLKKISKKGTRVHVQVRMFAARTLV